MGHETGKELMLVGSLVESWFDRLTTNGGLDRRVPKY